MPQVAAHGGVDLLLIDLIDLRGVRVGVKDRPATSAPPPDGPVREINNRESAAETGKESPLIFVGTSRRPLNPNRHSMWHYNFCRAPPCWRTS